MNTCALCGQNIYKGGVCSNCWREWTITGATPIANIQWLVELVRIHRKFEGNGNEIREYTFTDLGMEMD